MTDITTAKKIGYKQAFKAITIGLGIAYLIMAIAQQSIDVEKQYKALLAEEDRLRERFNSFCRNRTASPDDLRRAPIKKCLLAFWSSVQLP